MEKISFDDVDTQLCPHLKPVEDYLRERGITDGYVFTKNDAGFKLWRTVVQVDAVLGVPAIRKKLKLPRCVRNWDDFDYKTGGEYGFYCDVDKDALLGNHPKTLFTGPKIS